MYDKIFIVFIFDYGMVFFGVKILVYELGLCVFFVVCNFYEKIWGVVFEVLISYIDIVFFLIDFVGVFDVEVNGLKDWYDFDVYWWECGE